MTIGYPAFYSVVTPSTSTGAFVESSNFHYAHFACSNRTFMCHSEAVGFRSTQSRDVSLFRVFEPEKLSGQYGAITEAVLIEGYVKREHYMGQKLLERAVSLCNPLRDHLNDTLV